MKIGDKVRFLNEVGGGIVSGFDGKNIALVEDEDGFEIPVSVHECVVIETDDYNIDIQKKNLSLPNNKTEEHSTSVKAMLKKEEPEEQDEVEPYERPFTYKRRAEERSGGDALNLYLCFLPVEVAELSKTDFDVYLVNDSNYSLDFTYLCGEGKGWQLRYHGTAEPNTKMFIETFQRDCINDLKHLCLQFVAYKEDRSFLLKPTQSIELRPDLTKFYKLHTFSPNDFFEERVLTFELIINDQPARQVFTNAEDIREALLGEKNKQEEAPHPHVHAIAIKKEHTDDIEVVDLHASELLDNMKGLKPADILEYQLDVFRKKMEQYKNLKGKKLIFIHGKGQGVLRNAVLRELHHSYKNCTSQDASFREYGFGATMVIIH